MTKDQADMWARVAAKIDWSPNHAIATPEDARNPTIAAIRMTDGTWECCHVIHDAGGHPVSYVEFDPPENPADERLLSRYVEQVHKERGLDYIETLSDGRWEGLWCEPMVCDMADGLLAIARDNCRVTARGMAIDALVSE